MKWSLIVLILLMAAYIGFFYFTNKKRQKEFTDFQTALKPGQRVYLNDGIYGNIISLSDVTCELEIADGVIITVNRSVIAGVDKPKDVVVPEEPAAPIEEPSFNDEVETKIEKAGTSAKKAAKKSTKKK